MARAQFTTEQVQDIIGPLPRITAKMEVVSTGARTFSKVGKDTWEEWGTCQSD